MIAAMKARPCLVRKSGSEREPHAVCVVDDLWIVHAVAAVIKVFAEASAEDIVVVLAMKRVVPASPEEKIVTRTAAKHVVARTAQERVVTRAADECVVSTAAFELVVSLTAKDGDDRRHRILNDNEVVTVVRVDVDGATGLQGRSARSARRPQATCCQSYYRR